MNTFNIDGVDYDFEALSDDAKAQILSIQFVDAELARLQAQAAAYQTARMGYANELKKHLNVLGMDTIKFN